MSIEKLRELKCYVDKYMKNRRTVNLEEQRKAIHGIIDEKISSISAVSNNDFCDAINSLTDIENNFMKGLSINYKPDYSFGISMGIMTLKEKISEKTWILVEDDRPNPYESVLLMTVGYNMRLGYRTGHNQYWESGGAITDRVIAWLPIPVYTHEH